MTIQAAQLCPCGDGREAPRCTFFSRLLSSSEKGISLTFPVNAAEFSILS